VWFGTSELGIQYSYEKYGPKGREYYERMRQEIDELVQDAKTSIRRFCQGSKKWEILLSKL